MPIDWLNEYVGIPYQVGGRTHAGVDCYGLVRLILNEKLGANMPAFDISPDATAARMVRALTEGTAQMRSEGHAVPVATPHDLTIVVIRRGEIADHCGLFAGDYVLHAHRDFKSSLLEPYELFTRFASNVEFYEWQP